MPGDPPWVHRALGRFSFRDLWRFDEVMRLHAGPRRLLVQWVPHGFGWRSMNVLFCLWLWRRAQAGDEIHLMVHEPFLSFREGSRKQDLAACVHRVMAVILLRAATRVWLSTSAWERFLRPFALHREIAFGCLPVPSNIPVHEAQDAGLFPAETLFASKPRVLGHFSSYSLDIAAQLRKIIPPLLSRQSGCVVQLLGRGSERFREEMIEAHPALRDRIFATGALSSDMLSEQLVACDVLLQPYPDGVTTRRTTVMATLEHGRPVVTTVGRLSEDFWADCGAVSVVPAEDPELFIRAVDQLVGDKDELIRMGQAAAAFYRANFGLDRVIRNLRSTVLPRPC
jgi:hypothetical protein